MAVAVVVAVAVDVIDTVIVAVHVHVHVHDTVGVIGTPHIGQALRRGGPTRHGALDA